MSDDAFLEVLAGCTDVCATMDLSDDKWYPPDGEYDVSIEGITTNTKEKDGVNCAGVKAVFSIVDGEFQGRTFSDFYWIVPGSDEWRDLINLKNLLRFATCMGGRRIQDPIEAVTILREAENEFLTVEVYRTTAKKGGRVFTNVRFLRTLVATEASS